MFYKRAVVHATARSAARFQALQRPSGDFTKGGHSAAAGYVMPWVIHFYAASPPFGDRDGAGTHPGRRPASPSESPPPAAAPRVPTDSWRRAHAGGRATGRPGARVCCDMDRYICEAGSAQFIHVATAGSDRLMASPTARRRAGNRATGRPPASPAGVRSPARA